MLPFQPRVPTEELLKAWHRGKALPLKEPAAYHAWAVGAGVASLMTSWVPGSLIWAGRAATCHEDECGSQLAHHRCSQAARLLKTTLAGSVSSLPTHASGPSSVASAVKLPVPRTRRPPCCPNTAALRPHASLQPCPPPPVPSRGLGRVRLHAWCPLHPGLCPRLTHVRRCAPGWLT